MSLKPKEIWKPNCFAPTLSAWLHKIGFYRCKENNSWLHNDGFEVKTNYRKREFTFAFGNGEVKYFKTQTDFKNYITNLLELGTDKKK